ncbi:hypothetical protein [Acinetobacter baumannii]|uniref:hypothetical protein n=1 Tax=Acinetobacter baumannii TaxID=470 RepID=UPI000D69A87E|nr:hypothetical protein [Acinetobacter baumannii]MBI1412550.1 hypothetical protein [Acinetobacter baumannii]MBI1426484.1 hypothetical protein [Acinetobacter baumannii]QLI35265.1 hypothetical protein HLG75_04180 [Acinetobacter baumannii]
MFEDFLVSSDTAAVLSFIAFLILLFIGSNNKNIGIFHSVFNVYQYLKNRKIEYLKNQLASPVVEEEDKKTYQNELSVVTLQKELNLFYSEMIECLNTEINDNIWLQQNTEDISNAQNKIDELIKILSIEEELCKNIDNLMFLKKKCYNHKTLEAWIRQNKSKPEWKRLFKKL